MSLTQFRSEILKNAAGMGVKSLTSFQTKAVQSILNQQNTAILSQPGSGKSLSYVLALSQMLSLNINKNPSIYTESSLNTLFKAHQTSKIKPPNHGALIIVPTQELSLEIYKYFRLIAPWLNIGRTNSSLPEVAKSINFTNDDSINEESIKQQSFHNLALSIDWGVIDILISTPSILSQIVEYRIAINESIINPKTIVIDEMDLILEEKSFSNSLSRVFSLIEHCNKKHFILSGSLYPYSAFSPSPASILEKNFNNLKFVVSDDYNKIPENLVFKFYYLNETKQSGMSELIEIVEKNYNDRFVIFGAYISRCMDIKNSLMGKGIGTSILLGDMNLEERIEEQMDFFKKNRVLVSIDIAARGIEYNASHVVIYNLPKNPSLLVNRIGRVGRNGKKGNVHIFLNQNENEISNLLKPGELWEPVFKFYLSKNKQKLKVHNILDVDINESSDD
ncbi:hypothetical protein SteCoe_12379 [Stentor coeruleus]|uniref:ATP-dependent RNA helicase n=1 Tax=Stentor coeruleus TaxID=5963 RepID=A0A1R2CB13_9CILI|nr:hypothetical protein SteCoe_12379 [Stentor coeruleus]